MFPKVDIKDYESNKKLSSVREFFLIDRSQLAIYFLISLIAIMMLNFDTIWALITNSTTEFNVAAKDVINIELSNYSSFLQSDLLGRATGFVVWGFIGSIAYMGVWIVQHFFIRVKHDVLEEGFVHQSQGIGSYWESKLAQIVLLFAAAITFIGVLLTLFFALPIIGSLGSACLEQPTELISYLYLLLGLCLGVLAQYVLVRSWRIVKYAFASFFDGTEE